MAATGKFKINGSSNGIVNTYNNVIRLDFYDIAEAAEIVITDNYTHGTYDEDYFDDYAYAQNQPYQNSIEYTLPDRYGIYTISVVFIDSNGVEGSEYTRQVRYVPEVQIPDFTLTPASDGSGVYINPILSLISEGSITVTGATPDYWDMTFLPKEFTGFSRDYFLTSTSSVIKVFNNKWEYIGSTEDYGKFYTGICYDPVENCIWSQGWTNLDPYNIRKWTMAEENGIVTVTDSGFYFSADDCIGIATDGTYIYGMTREKYIKIWDKSGNLIKTIYTSDYTANSSYNEGIEVFNGYLYFGSNNGYIHVLDISDVNNPKFVTEYDFGGDLDKICTDGYYLYFNDGSSTTMYRCQLLPRVQAYRSQNASSGYKLVDGIDELYPNLSELTYHAYDGTQVLVEDSMLKMYGYTSRNWGKCDIRWGKTFGRNVVLEADCYFVDNCDFMIGFKRADSSTITYSDMPHAIFGYQDKSFRIYENGSGRFNAGSNTMPINRWCKLRIEVIKGVVRYYLDGKLMYQSTYAQNENLEPYINVAYAFWHYFRNIKVYNLDYITYDQEAKDLTSPSITNLQCVSHEINNPSRTKDIEFTWAGNLGSGTTYYYYIVAIDAYGNRSNWAKNPNFDEKDLVWSKPSYVALVTDTVSEPYGLSITSADGSWAGSYQQTDITEAGVYYFRTYFKTDIGHNGMVFLGDAINYGQWATSKSWAGTGNWAIGEHYLDMPSGFAHFRIYIYGQSGGAGTTIYDNIELHKVKSTLVRAPMAGYSIAFNMEPSDSPVLSEATYSETLTDGEFIFYVKAINEIGTTSSTRSIGPFIIDSTAPVIVSVEFSQNPTTVDNSIIIKVRITD